MAIPKTNFIKVLERIHKNTDMRYGQIIKNAWNLEYRYGDPTKQVRDFNVDCFNLYDEDMTALLERFEKLLNQQLGGEKVIRGDGRVEWLCKHGVGHTIDAPAEYRKLNPNSWQTHGCDGCCSSTQS